MLEDSTLLPERVVVVLAADLPAGRAANVAACIAAGLAAARPGWAGRPLTDAAGMPSVASSHQPIVLLSADDARMTHLLARWSTEHDKKPPCAWLSIFPAYAQSVHDAPTYWQQHEVTDHQTEALLGIGLAGSKRWVNSLTGSLPLWR